MPVTTSSAASVAAVSTSGAAALGLLARAGLVPAGLRWLHHLLYLLGVLATAATSLAARTGRRRSRGAFALGVLAMLPRTRPGSALHVAVGATAVASVVALRASSAGSGCGDGRRCG